MTVTARDVALIAVGGAAGSVLRYLVASFIGPDAGRSTHWHWHTFVVNVSGAFVIGLLLVLAAKYGWPGWWRPFLAVGVLGGYTTFSTYALEVVDLALRGQSGLAAGYATGSVFAAVGGCWLGIMVGRAI